MSVRGLRFLAAGYLVAAAACFAYALIERGVKWWHLPDLFVVGSIEVGDWFDPFRPAHPYLWLGLGAGLLLAAVTLELCAQLAGRRSSHRPGTSGRVDSEV